MSFYVARARQQDRLLLPPNNIVHKRLDSTGAEKNEIIFLVSMYLTAAVQGDIFEEIAAVNFSLHSVLAAGQLEFQSEPSTRGVLHIFALKSTQRQAKQLSKGQHGPH